MPIFDDDKLARELSALPIKHRIAFAASCCERLLDNYHAFTLMEKWGDPGSLNCAVDEVWQFLKGRASPEYRIRQLLQACSDAIPLGDFLYLFSTLAQEAATAVCYTLECCLDIQKIDAYTEQGTLFVIEQDPLQHCLEENAKRAAHVGSLAFETVCNYIDILTSPRYFCEPFVSELEKNTRYYHAYLDMVEGSSRKLLDPDRKLVDAWIEQSPLLTVELEKQRQDLKILKSRTELDRGFLDCLRESSRRFGVQPFARRLDVIRNKVNRIHD